MKARALLRSGVLDPEELKIAHQAFDRAWEMIAPEVSTRPQALEAARLKLAELVLGLMRDNKATDAATLTQIAAQLWSADPPEMPV